MTSCRNRVAGWRAAIAILGTRESKTFSTKAKAAAWASERETEIRRGANSGIVIGKSGGDAFDRYLEEVSIHKRASDRSAWGSCMTATHCWPNGARPRRSHERRPARLGNLGRRPAGQAAAGPAPRHQPQGCHRPAPHPDATHQGAASTG